jgi:uroporphyrinogen-III synthase
MLPRQVNSLQGLHLLVTRPVDQAHVWARQLRALGGMVTVQSMLVIEPLTDKESTACIAGIIQRFDEFQKVIFISQNAVVHGVKWLSRCWPQLPSEVEFFAIGASTAVSLENRDVNVQSVGIAMNSEALLELAAMQNIDRQKILIFRGRGGRTHLGDRLSKRGASVEYCELYRRKLPSPQVQVLPPTFYKTVRLIPITTVHSGETLINLVKIVLPSQLTWLQKQPLLTPGERVAAIAAGTGFAEVIIARNATHKGMTEALYEWRQQQS